MTAWIDAELRARAGALVPAALAFLADLGPCGAGRAPGSCAFPPGAPGLVELARALVRFARDPAADDEADRRFVEGAGALLGLLLLQAFPGARFRSQRGAHLLQMSEHGFFDPFHAVDAALSAPRVREALARHVGDAEGEAHGHGPTARVGAAFAARLARARPELRVHAGFAGVLVVSMPDGDEIEVDLGATIRATRDAPAASVAHAVDKLIAMLPGAAHAPPTLDDVRARLFPRLTSSAALAELSARAGAELVARVVAGEIVSALVLEELGRARYVRARELAAWGLTTADALALATDNLAQASGRTRVLREDTADGPLFMVRSGDGRDSARVLLPELRGPLEAHVGAQAVVSVPHRDVLLACDARSLPLVRQLRARAEADAARAPHRVSSALFVLGADGLRPL